MKNLYQKYVSLLLGILLVSSLIVPPTSAESYESTVVQSAALESSQVDQMLSDTLRFYGNERFDPKHFPWGPLELTWTEVVALQASSSSLTDGTFKMPEWIEKDPGLKETTADTEHIRYIFGLLAAGKDPSDAWETHRNLYAELAAQQKEDGSIGGVNKHSWAMLALDAGVKLGQDTGSWNTENEEKALKHLLKQELPGGGFTLWGDKVDPDMTGMVLLPLANYQNKPAVLETIKRAKESLRKQQLDSAGWGTGTKPNSNSTATVISGLLAVKEDPMAISWKKDGRTPIDALQEFQLDNGGFAFMPGAGQTANIKATEQSLVALQEIKDGQSVWQKLANAAPVTPNPSIQAPENIETTIRNGKLHIQIRDDQLGEWLPVKVEEMKVAGEYVTIQVSESATATEGIELPAGNKKVVVLHNDRPYTYFESDDNTVPMKEWEVKFSAALLDTNENLKNVTIQNAAGEMIEAEARIGNDKRSIKIKPTADYKTGELYYITIADIKSASGVILKMPIRKIFIVR